jgi:hypothetical protein
VVGGERSELLGLADAVVLDEQGDLAGHFGAWRVNGLPSGFRQRLAEVA